jgi:hypothetical protein
MLLFLYLVSFFLDALQIIWPIPSALKSTSPNDKEILIWILKIIEIAQYIASIESNLEKKISDIRVPPEFDVKIMNGLFLKVKVSVTFGSVFGVFVGDVQSRLEFLITGKPLLELEEAEHHQRQSGRVVISPSLWTKIQELSKQLKVENLESFKNAEAVGEGFIELKQNEHIQASRWKSNSNSNKLATIEKSDVDLYQMFAPLPVRKYFEAQQTNKSNQLKSSQPERTVRAELRKISTIFILLHENFSTPNAFERLNQATVIILVC